MFALLSIIKEQGKKPGVIAWTCVGMLVLLLTLANVGLPLVNATRSSYSFADITPTSSFWAYAEHLHSLGVIEGTPCGGVDIPCDEEKRPYLLPGSKITRGELARMLGLARKYTPSSVTQRFADVAPTHPHIGWIEVAAHNSLMQGFPCGAQGETCDAEKRPYFRPDAVLSRADLAGIMTFASPQSIKPRLTLRRQSLEDVSPTHPSWQSIEVVFAIGIMTGYSCSGCAGSKPCVPPNNRPYFLPDNDVTRGQVVKAVAQWFVRIDGQ